MQRSFEQILTVAEMGRAEQALIDAGSSVDALMQIAGRGAAEYVWRVAAGHRVTVLCGPGNNGGDGWVIAEAIRERGGEVAVVAAADPATPAAINARASYGGAVLAPGAAAHGEVFVDCLFGSGLKRPLSAAQVELIQGLAGAHRHSVAIDLPSGVEADSGVPLNVGLPRFELTVALGAWKFAHFLMPASAGMGASRLVDIGVAPVEGAARTIERPHIVAPGPDAHKYRRGMLAVVGGAMPGAAVLACVAAQGAGAGYVKLFADAVPAAGPDIVVATGKLSQVLADDRNAAILVGPGLGRDSAARERLATALADQVPAVIDADGLVLLQARQLAERSSPLIVTPHDGELATLEAAFGSAGPKAKTERALALAAASGAVVVAKGADTIVAAPDGRLACSRRASSWLSVAGTGDVLAGVIASRLATGVEPFQAACDGVWLHGEAARLAGPAFTATRLAELIPAAMRACL